MTARPLRRHNALVDARDAQILAGLMEMCRAPLRDVALALGVSGAAVHKRILALEEAGVIRQYRGLVHPTLLGARAVEIHGCSRLSVTRELCDRLGAHPCVFQVTIGSHNHLYVTALIRQEHELEEVIRAVRDCAGLTGPGVRTYRMGKPPHHVLTAFDCQLVHALAHRARRPLAELSRLVAVSERRVSRRLQHLIDTGCLMLTLDLATDGAGGHWTQLELATDGRESPEAVLRGAVAGGESQVLWISRFEETPLEIHAWTWSASTGALHSLLGHISSRPSVTRVVPGVLLASHDYPTWVRDELIRRSTAATPSTAA